MKNSDSSISYPHTFTIREENRVPGFEPQRYMKATAAGPKLDISTKKVWFRLRYPDGRIFVRTLHFTEQMALVEARIFLHKTDSSPAYTTTVQRMTNDIPDGLHLLTAHNDAIDQVLGDAGFTVERCSDASPRTDLTQPVQPVKENTPTADAVTPPVPKIPEKEAEAEKESIHAEPVPTEELGFIPTVILSEKPSEPVDSAGIPEEETAVPNAQDNDRSKEEPPYTMHTPVDEICSKMSLQEALDYVITTGSCVGWTMARAIARRPASVKFYLTPGYKGEDNILRASAKIVLAEAEKMLAG